jgi:endonuclease/exonuclease/phosphatase family metal-dependent hydrolase
MSMRYPPPIDLPVRLSVLSAVWLVSFGVLPIGAQTTGTFIDREQPTDLRVMSYNIWQDSIFADTNATRAAKFARVVQALQPDILNLQEIYDHSAAQTASLLDSILPLTGGATWYAHQSFDNILVSKYPLTMTETDTIPEPSSTSVALAVVDLPNELFDTDFYFMNSHFKCCGTTGSSEDLQRQRQADALVNWMRDARSPGEYVNLPAGTPMAVVGDLNIVGSQQPLNSLISGNIINEETYGSDSPPDWDGTILGDAHPLHNGSGPDDYTWHDGTSAFPDNRLDYVLYTDSVVDVANHFVLNTVAMTSAERTAAGLQTYDVMLNPSDWDHLPVVVDFRFPPPPLPGDYNSDGAVDPLDYDIWSAAFGTSSAAADGNGDGIVNAADYAIWRDNLGHANQPPGSGAVTAVPEPVGALLFAITAGAIMFFRPRRSQIKPFIN